ncbi:MAG: RidA family protein [Puniceicoccales bacterium]|jgi:enamine deaminase RidA (YjgF/YER057c/UK114 family)|nr:RidA family protein [Puniceicoccales bacterium]
MDYETELTRSGITLPPPPAAVAAYVPFVRSGKLLFLSGTLPVADGQVAYKGKINADPARIAEGQAAARLCALNTLANIKAALGTLNKVVRVVSLTGFVNGEDDFAESPRVINGASELFVKVFGDAGKHSRAAVSVNGLPLNASVEIAAIVEVSD